jgi:hypothetical protein
MRIGRRPFMLAAASSMLATPAAADSLPFERPGTLVAFLQNMKHAAEERLLLDETFYGEANLKNAFAAAHVVYGLPQEGFRLYGTVAGFGNLIDAVRIGGSVREGMQLDFTLSSPENAAPEGNLRLSFMLARRSFEDVEAAFGKQWKPAAYRGRSTNVEPYALRNHGSTAINYSLGDGPPGRWMIFSFDARALLELVSVANQ